MVTSNALTPVDANYSQASVHVKSELTELHTVTEPSLVPGLSPQQQGNTLITYAVREKFEVLYES